MQKPDSLIFDMDGTLWDAVDTYAESWNLIFQKYDIKRVVKRDELMPVMGLDAKRLIQVLLPEFDEDGGMEIYYEVNQVRREILPTSGGVMYKGVTEGIEQLSAKYKIFVLSNCAVGIIPLFLHWAKITDFVTDVMAYGTNQQPKNYNMHLLMDKHGLRSPVYVGDTNGDAEQTRLADIPFTFVSYGFGNTDNYDQKFDDFESLTQYYLGL